MATRRHHNIDNPETIMTCHHCGSPWFDNDGYGGIRCSDCDTPTTTTPAVTR